MAQLDENNSPPDTVVFPVGPISTVEQSVANLTALLQDLDPAAVQPLNANTAYENRLVEVRLGIAGSLFAALRMKHAPSAAHSLRVALGCSSWAFAMGLEPERRDELEVAALLHDIGKIGAPDQLLLKPGPLAGDEAALMNQHRLAGPDILASYCPSNAIVDIIRYSAGWYDGTRPSHPPIGEEIPVGARMLAIVDAFDSMTTEQVYRRSMSRERALHELYAHAGTQFDPELVKSFCALKITAQLHHKVVGHWLESLDPRKSNRFWHQFSAPTEPGSEIIDQLFQQKLLENMHDAVIFVDNNGQITLWNRGAERLTGIAASSICHRTWSPALVGMREENSHGVIADSDCPVHYALKTGVQSLRRLIVADRNNRPVAVDLHTIAVVGPDGTTRGVTMLLHDASPEASLEKDCQNLHERATRDPLTQLANRAEFDRTLELFVKTHEERKVPCSLIICDVDRFKFINDTFGHPAGDEVIRTFGQVLKSECRSGDLAARYGGEEFVLLCADCNNTTATQRAEQLRAAISSLPQPNLNGHQVTVSFGVTELQLGDTPDSMLHRADRALLEAKRGGRNMVVQLGSGIGVIDDIQTRPDKYRKRSAGNSILDRQLVTFVPLSMAVEKVRGFVIDHGAEIQAIESDRMDLLIEADHRQNGRRRSDRPIPFLVELSFSEQHVPIPTADGRDAGRLVRTRVRVTIRLKCSRDRRVNDVAQQAGRVLAGIKSYLMAIDETTEAQPGTTRRTVNMLAPWRRMRE